MNRGPRARAAGVALLSAFVLLLVTRQLGCHGASAGHGIYRAQVEAFLDGRLALTTLPEGLAHDLAWTESGVQQVWGLGVPMWQAPVAVAAKAVGVTPPDRVAMGLWLALTAFVLLRAFGRRDDAPWWLGAGAIVVTALLPAFVTLVRGRLGVYEEAAIYAYGAAMILLGGLVILARAPTTTRYVLLVAAAGLAPMIRPTLATYGLATALLATAVLWRAHGRGAVRAIALGAALFVTGAGALYATNVARFGSGTEFGHRLNLQGLSGNIRATRFDYPFQQAGLGEAAVELVGAMFGRPEQARERGFYGTALHVGQSERVRWREYYFTTYSWPYVLGILAGLLVGARAWRRRDDPDRWLLAWAVIGGLPIALYYMRAPFLSSRYLLDLAPAIAALLVLAWRGVATWAAPRRRGVVAFGVLVALWATAVLTSRVRKRIDVDPTDAAAAAEATLARVAPVPVPRTMPPSYTAGDASWIAATGNERPHGLYLNGVGWELATGRVPSAMYVFVEDPAFVEVEVVGTPDVRARIGLDELAIVSRTPTTIRFAVPRPLRGIRVVFLAFGPASEIGRDRTDVVLRAIRWR